MTRTTPTTRTVPPIDRETARADMLAQFRKWRETQDSPETIAARQERIAQMRQIAKGADTGTPLLEAGLVLVRLMDASKPDHIALAIGAHRLIWLAVKQDIAGIGQPGADEHPRLLTLLCLYLDDCGWHWGVGAMHDDYDSREVMARLFPVQS